MTGFGAAFADVGETRYRVHVRSVNHRFLEARVRAPKELAAFEHDFVARIKGVVKRGHVDLTISMDSSAPPPPSIHFDSVAAARVLADARAFASAHGLSHEVSLGQLLLTPGVVCASDDVGDTGAPAVLAAVEAALRVLAEMRATEGQSLARDLLGRVEHLRSISAGLEQRHVDSGPERHARLARRVQAVVREQRPVSDRDEPLRLESELIALVERSDVTEELVRLRSHLDVFSRVLGGESVAGDAGHGKKLEFLVQEIGRELNTIGSKSPDAEITQAVVDGKCELERIREQVSNLE